MLLKDLAVTMVLIMKFIFSVLFRIMKIIFLVGTVGHSSQLKNRYLRKDIGELIVDSFSLSALTQIFAIRWAL